MASFNLIDFILWFFRLIFIIYFTLCIFLLLMQRSLLYRPSSLNLQYVNLPKGFYLSSINTEDDLKLNVIWSDRKDPTRPILVYFHGNAGSVYDRLEKLQEWYEAGYGVFAVSYRGYGGSEGKPSEKGLYNDARAAINSLLAQGYNSNNIWLYGESLGSGVAIQMATEYEFQLLILEAPYTSVTDRASEIYWYVPVKLLMQDHFDSVSKLPAVKEPIVIFHGNLDKIIPVHHGKGLYNVADKPKHIHIFENIDHSNFDNNEIILKSQQFLAAQ